MRRSTLAGLIAVVAVLVVLVVGLASESGDSESSREKPSPASALESFPGFAQMDPATQERLRASFVKPDAPVRDFPRPNQRGPTGGRMTGVLRPEWVHSDPDYFSPAQFWPVKNGWQVASHRQFTAVYGGGDGAGDGHNSTGRIAVFHVNYLNSGQDVDMVDVPDAGPLRLTAAPTGNRTGLNRIASGATLRFAGKNGITGEFHLRDHSVTVD